MRGKNKLAEKVCPYCKTKIENSDDIVMCSLCEMPHHRECWIENNGCTTFGCTGTINNTHEKIVTRNENLQNTATVKPEIRTDYNNFSKKNTDLKPIYCEACGLKDDGSRRFCRKCGGSLEMKKIEEEETITVFEEEKPISLKDEPLSDIYSPIKPQTMIYEKEDDFQITFDEPVPENNIKINSEPLNQKTGNDEVIHQKLIGKNSEYYLMKFKQLNIKQKKSSWNFVAFFWLGFWLVYRKMYAYATALIISEIVMSFVLDSYLYIFTIGVRITAGILGNYIYKKFIYTKTYSAHLLTGTQKQMYIKKHGGVNIWLTIVIVVIYLGLQFIQYY